MYSAMFMVLHYLSCESDDVSKYDHSNVTEQEWKDEDEEDRIAR